MQSAALFLKRFVAFCLVLALTLPPAAAQQPGQQAPGATFTAEANLVLVPVVVLDRSGKHVSGLKASDFTVLDNGKPQQVVSFEEVKNVPTKLQKRGLEGYYTNAAGSPGAAAGVTIIVLDQVNTPFLDQSYARAQLLKYLASNVSTNEPTALVMIGRRGVRVIHDFTTDPALLVAALKKVAGRIDQPGLDATTTHPAGTLPGGSAPSPALRSTGESPSANEALFNREVTALDQFYDGTDGGYGRFAIIQAIEITLNALRHIAQGLEGIPGRKSLIWATGGFPFSLTSSGELATLRYYTTGATRQDLGGGTAGGILADGSLPPLPESNSSTSDEFLTAIRPFFQRTMQALNRANIAIYPIDARGLVAYSSAASHRVRINDVYGTEAQTHSTMNEIADVTGGKAIYNTNDLSSAFQRVASESAQYYMIGYYGEKVNKAQWRKLQVKVTRPDTQVRARAGYMAGPVTARKAEDVKNQDVAAALASPLDYTAIPLNVRWLGPPAPGSGGKKKAQFEIILPGNAGLIDTANKNRLDLDILAVARDAQGEAAGHMGQKVQANLQDDVVKQIAQIGMNFAETLEVPPGTYQVRFIVRDNVTGRLGSVNAPLVVQ